MQRASRWIPTPPVLSPRCSKPPPPSRPPQLFSRCVSRAPPNAQHMLRGLLQWGGRPAATQGTVSGWKQYSPSLCSSFTSASKQHTHPFLPCMNAATVRRARRGGRGERGRKKGQSARTVKRRKKQQQQKQKGEAGKASSKNVAVGTGLHIVQQTVCSRAVLTLKLLNKTRDGGAPAPTSELHSRSSSHSS